MRTAPRVRGHFLTGNLPEIFGDPLSFFTRAARDYGDIVLLRQLNTPLYLVSRPDYIESVLVTNNQNFVKSIGLRRSRLLLGNGLLTSEGDFWRHQRRLIQPAFHRQRITTYGETMVAYAERTAAQWRDGATCDIHPEMMRLTLQIVAKTLFDADVTQDTDEVGQALEVVLRQFIARAATGFLVPETWPTPGNLRMRRAVARLDRIIYRIIEERRREDKDHGDLLSILLCAQDDEGTTMTDKQLRDEVMTLFLAGHETTAIALSWTWYLLSQNPEVEHKLHAELKDVLGGRPPTVADLARLPYTDAVIKESMRLYPPAWVIGREALAPFQLGDYALPKGATVLTSQWVMHRDPRYFDEPERFSPERWSGEFERRLPRFAYFPFGGGPRQCIGNSFAVMEANLLLATLAQHFTLSLSSEARIKPLPAITLRPRYGIPMILQTR